MAPDCVAALSSREPLSNSTSRKTSARTISTGVGIAPQRRNIARSGGLGDSPRLFQFSIHPQGCAVGPAYDSQPTQGARECDQRRHRSILIVHSPSPIHILAQARPACNRIVLDQMRPQNPNLAQIALLSSAEISSSGQPATSPSEASVPAPADLRPKSPDNSPVAGATTGMSTFSP